MKQIKVAWLFIVLISSMSSNSVWAHGRGGWGGHYGGGHYGGWGYRGGYYGGYYGGLGLGLGLGLGYGPGYYGGYPYYAYPPVITTVPAAPPVYIQQVVPQTVPQQPQANYWHYCRNPEGYYPYVKECPGGWQQVSPTPPAPR